LARAEKDEVMPRLTPPRPGHSCEPLEDRRLLAAETLIAAGSVWKYLDNGSNQGTAWVAPAFSDATWNSGAAQLGYGDGDEATRVSTGSSTSAKAITTYFRRSFSVTNLSTVSQLLLKLKRDDGAVIYLNGREVRRTNMPTGAVSYTTRAVTAIGGTDENVFNPYTLDKSALVEGNNVIAVELHQSSPDSSDISFDLALQVDRVSTSPPAPADPFTVVMMPDTQFYAQSYPGTFNAQTDWIASRTGPDNIRFVTLPGDIVQNGASGADRNLTEWTRADTAMDRLDGVVPYSASLGNHDYDVVDNHSSATRYVEFFGPNRYAGRTWFGGASADQRNQYQIFSGGGYQFLHISLEWEAPDSALAWAQSVLNAHPGMPVMVSTHSYLKPDGTRSTSASYSAGNSGEAMWNEFVRVNPQVFMVMNGHYTGERHRVVTNNAGLPVIEMVVDYQGRSEGGQGFLRVMKFVPGENRIDFSTYSPSKGIYETDSNSQFSIPLDFVARFGQPAGTTSLSAVSTTSSTTTTRQTAKSPTLRPRLLAAPATPFATAGTVCGSSSLLDDDKVLMA
jgi:hypothetical protein